MLVYPLGAGFFLFGHVTEGTLRTGIALIVAGEAIRCWANGYVGQSKVNQGGSGRLITAGPYAFVRHPLYLGTFLIGSGFRAPVLRLHVTRRARRSRRLGTVFGGFTFLRLLRRFRPSITRLLHFRDIRLHLSKKSRHRLHDRRPRATRLVRFRVLRI